MTTDGILFTGHDSFYRILAGPPGTTLMGWNPPSPRATWSNATALIRCLCRKHAAQSMTQSKSGQIMR